jgi:hypothetical protein
MMTTKPDIEWELGQARHFYGLVRQFGVRGKGTPPPMYRLARREFLASLTTLRDLGVPQREIAEALGISRPGVAQWYAQAKGV